MVKDSVGKDEDAPNGSSKESLNELLVAATAGGEADDAGKGTCAASLAPNGDTTSV